MQPSRRLRDSKRQCQDAELPSLDGLRLNEPTPTRTEATVSPVEVRKAVRVDAREVGNVMRNLCKTDWTFAVFLRKILLESNAL